jgi:HPt (histidine-containing phosphotransfer) domain-containing protein
MDDLMKKPFEQEDIERMLQKWLNADQKISHNVTSAATVPKNAVFDAGDMLRYFMDDEITALPLLSRFIERTGVQLKNFPALKEAGDWETARRDAHTLKGAAFSMGGTELGNAAAVLVQACKNASREETEAAYPLVQKAFSNFKKEAEEYISSKG